MAVVVSTFWEGATPEQYDELKKEVRWDVNPVPGGIHHVAWFTDRGMYAVDVWESAEDYQRWAESELMPGVQRLGLPGQPEIEIHQAHAINAPAYRTAGSR